MRRLLLFAAVAIVGGGCATGPLQENPFLLRTERVGEQANPIYLPQGPMAYAKVFEKVIDILDDYWDIAYANRYDGRIETIPRIAPGFEQPWRPGSPDFAQRLHAFLQSIRHRCVVQISTANDGGYFIDVKVFKELEDIAQPSRATAGPPVFRLPNTVERQFDVIESTTPDGGWIPIGRDYKLEQVILSRLACFDLSEAVKK
jgi:hypothetical protein